jgi:hypothetical protein
MLGLNIEVSFIRNGYSSDDIVGGAVITGSVVYSGIPARLSSRRPSQVSLDSGLEVERTFDLIINTQNLTLFERDEVQVTWPVDSPYYGERFRILGLQHDNRRPQRGHTEFTLSRIERSRARQ